MLPLEHPDRIHADDHRLVANAGLLCPPPGPPPGTGCTVDRYTWATPPGGPTPATSLTLVASALAGGDCIDDADALRSGGTARVLGCVVKAPSTLGTFLRSSAGGTSASGPGEPRAPGLGRRGRARRYHRY